MLSYFLKMAIEELLKSGNDFVSNMKQKTT